MARFHYSLFCRYAVVFDFRFRFRFRFRFCFRFRSRFHFRFRIHFRLRLDLPLALVVSSVASHIIRAESLGDYMGIHCI